MAVINPFPWDDDENLNANDLNAYIRKYQYGDGSSGASTISSDTDLGTCIKNYTDLTIDVTKTLTLGMHSRIYVSGTLTVNGTITVDTDTGTGGARGLDGDDSASGGVGGASGGVAYIFAKIMAGDGTIRANGAAGGNGVTTSVGNGDNGHAGGSGSDIEYYNQLITVTGSTGGSGGTSTSGVHAGGAGGVAGEALPTGWHNLSELTSRTVILQSGGGAGGGGSTGDDNTYLSGAGGGAGGSCGGKGGAGGRGGGTDGTGGNDGGAGGGGGGAGGILIIVTPDNNTSTFTIEANGAAGGNGDDNSDNDANAGDGGGGGGGAGGYIITLTDTNFATVQATAGAKGNVGGTHGDPNAEDGVAGSAGVAVELTPFS